MRFREAVLGELVRNGYSQRKDGVKVWNIASNPDLLYTSDSFVRNYLKLRAHPRYRKVVLSIEKALIKEHAKKVLAGLENEPCNLIDVGCADGEKFSTFLNALRHSGSFRCCALNASKRLVDLTISNVKKKKLKNVTAYLKFYRTMNEVDCVISEVRSTAYRRNIVLFFGSLLSLFEIHEMLFRISSAMLPGDRLVVGIGIRKGKRLQNLRNYTQKEFRRQFEPAMKEIGFRAGELEYGARFANARVEIFFKVKKARKVKFRGKTLAFNEGDEIVVAYIYKYFPNELKRIFRMYFRKVEMFKDNLEEYALVLSEK
ncbi:hypothetical protein D6817_02505 [Candidatus Pacearchaeota archaeon]|nr:MAG: hypothetical protein D6817_02505 [Candidatus Pacearchaeota archaeon]